MLLELQKVIDYDLEEMPYVPASENIAKALEFARNAHYGQERKTGEPFINHLISVVKILESAGLNAQHNENTLVAALLHDTVEDNPKISLEYISREFGPDVARIVDGVTKVDSDHGDIDTIKKMAKSGYLDPSVLIVKLADRLHNMRTLEPFSEDKQKDKAQETFDMYVGIAKDLGLWEMKRELEDLSFMYLSPDEYARIKQVVDTDPRRTDEEYINDLCKRIVDNLASYGINAQIEIRHEGYFAIHRKVQQAILEKKTSIERGISDITDVVSVRVIVTDTTALLTGDYYTQLLFGGEIDPLRYNRYIGTNTRPNGYSAIHNTLKNKRGAIEVAFVMQRMEDYNNRGIISLMSEGHIDEYERIMNCVISPTGKTTLMLTGSTGLDLAYRTSTEAGARAAEMFVDGARVPITTELINGTVVEIITDPQKKQPDPDHLAHCLPETRAMMEQQLNIAHSRELLDKGKSIAEEWLSERGILGFEALGTDIYTDLIVYYGRNSLNDLYRSIALGAIDKTRLDELLNEKNITKDDLGLTSLRFSGKDKQGILFFYTDVIRKSGGSIRESRAKVNAEDGTFTIEMVIEGLSAEVEYLLGDFFKHDLQVESFIVV